MMNAATAWTVEWSYDQQCFHVDRLEKTIERNVKAFYENKRTQYIVLSINPTQEAANEICSELQEVANAR